MSRALCNWKDTCILWSGYTKIDGFYMGDTIGQRSPRRAKRNRRKFTYEFKEHIVLLYKNSKPRLIL